MNLRGLFGSVAFFLVLGSVAAQQASPPSVSTSPNATKPSGDTKAGESYVIELLQNKLVFEADGKGYRDLTLQVSIKSESAVREFGLIAYPFAAAFESLDILYARVRKPDGSAVETPPSDIQEVDSGVSREAPMYTDQREKHIAIKSLSVGDQLEVHAHWTIHDPIAPGHFWYDHNFFREGACLKEILEFDVPRDVPVKLRNSDLQPSVRDNGARRVYTFENANLKKKEESKIPAWEKYYRGIPPPDVQISSFTSWKEVGNWFDSLARPKAAATPEIRAKAEDLVKGKTTDEEKIRALYSFVSSRFRYIGIDLGLGRYAPHSAVEVLTNRYGDCKDKHTLLAALLQAVNIPSNPALISSSFRFDAAFPTPALFDHVITAIPQGESFLFLDTTAEVAPFGFLIRTLRDRQALVVLPSGGARLATTPLNPPIANYETWRIDSSIDEKGTLDARMRIEERGDGELGLRLAYRATPQNSWQELTQRIAANMGFAGTVSDVSVAQPEDTTQPFWISFAYHRTDFPDWKSGRITLPAPPFLVRDLNEEQKLSKDPLPLGSPQEVTYDSTVKFPKGFSPILPQKVERRYDFAEFSATYSLKEDTLHGILHFKTLLNEIPSSDRSRYTSLAKTIFDTENSYIFLKGGASGMGVLGMLFGNSADAIPGLERALELAPDNDALRVRLSGLYCDAGRTSDAVALLKKGLVQHPEFPDLLHVALGKAYLKMPDVEKAMAEFKEGVGDNAETNELNDVAYALAEANVHLSEAQDYSARAVSALSKESMDISPEDAQPSDFSLMLQLAANWDTLGWIKFRAGDFTGAEKYLQSAWELVQNAGIGEHLMEAYEKLGKKGKAAAICNMALATYFPKQDAIAQKKLSEEMTSLRPYLNNSNTQPGHSGHPVQGSVALSDMRALTVPLHTKLPQNSASANFLISITTGPKVDNVVFVSGAEELRKATDALTALKYPQSFPDATATRIIRKGILSCSIYTKNCTLVLMLATDSAVPVPFTAVSAPTN